MIGGINMLELWAWRVGMLILAGVPAIVGGGLVWHFAGRWGAVWTWEIFVLAVLVWLLVKGGRRTEVIEEREGQNTANNEPVGHPLTTMLGSDEGELENNPRNIPL
jgi:hypothetical protein